MRFLLICAIAACSTRSATLSHEAYVWQRDWTGAVREAVAAAPTELAGLRVLALEIEPAGPVSPAIDVAALAASHRPITAVVRIDGSRPIRDLSLAPLLARLASWRAAGVDVAGVEIDHDCATAALADYAVWLARARPAGLRWSITALPAWTGSPELARVAAVVDRLVVQVHAVHAPSLFDAGQARRWVDAFARALDGRAFAVAVPTYRVVVGGEALEADPVAVAGFVRTLERDPVPGLDGVVWFRLPVASDLATWRTATLRAAITGHPLAAAVTARTVERRPGVFDLVIANAGTIDARYPELRVAGTIADLDPVGGYRRDAQQLEPPDRLLPAGSEVVVGWATGQEITLDAP